jgi:hypothetical protein
MDRNLRDHGSTNAAIDLAGCFWEPWLSMWRFGALLLVEPWDNAMRALATRAELMLRRRGDPAGHPRPHVIADTPAFSQTEKTNALVMHNMAKPVPAEPQVHVFCPSCGELTAITGIGPIIFEPSMEEITYCCTHCGTETNVQIARHARFSEFVSPICNRFDAARKTGATKVGCHEP